MPAMLVPMLGSVMSSISSITAGGVSTGAIITGIGAAGSMTGVGQAVNQMSQQSSQSGVSLAKTAFSSSGMTRLAKTGPMFGISRVSSALEAKQRFGNIGKTADHVANNDNVSSVSGGTSLSDATDLGDADSVL
jgi:hypothetical protein